MNIKEIVEYRDSLRESMDFNSHTMIENYKAYANENQIFRTLNDDKTVIKTYGMKDRLGVHKTGDTNRIEEAICLALYNSFNDKLLKVADYSQYIADYQTPLKNSDNDKKLKGIDLIGYISGSSKKRLCFWEVKRSLDGNRNKDNIHYAIMELLIYFSQFDRINGNREKASRNLEILIFEIAYQRGIGIENNNIIRIPPASSSVLFFAADEKYYEENDWVINKVKYLELKKLIKKELGLILCFVQINKEYPYDENSKKYFYIQDSVKVLL